MTYTSFTGSIDGEHNRQVVAKIIKELPTNRDKVKYTSEQIRGDHLPSVIIAIIHII